MAERLTYLKEEFLRLGFTEEMLSSSGGIGWQAFALRDGPIRIRAAFIGEDGEYAKLMAQDRWDPGGYNFAPRDVLQSR